jgi:hypothetical protein
VKYVLPTPSRTMVFFIGNASQTSKIHSSVLAECSRAGFWERAAQLTPDLQHLFPHRVGLECRFPCQPG